jgi:TRAP-type transport system small permease protein
MSVIVDLYFRALKGAIVGLLAALVAIVLGNVILRYAFNLGISFAEELARWIFVWLTFLAAIVALRNDQHMRIMLVFDRLPPATQRLFGLASRLLMLYASWLVLRGCWNQMIVNWGSVAPSVRLSFGWFYGAGVFFGLSAMPIILVDMYLLATGSEPLREPSSTQTIE